MKYLIGILLQYAARYPIRVKCVGPKVDRNQLFSVRLQWLNVRTWQVCLYKMTIRGGAEEGLPPPPNLHRQSLIFNETNTTKYRPVKIKLGWWISAPPPQKILATRSIIPLINPTAPSKQKIHLYNLDDLLLMLTVSNDLQVAHYQAAAVVPQVETRLHRGHNTSETEALTSTTGE